MFDKTITLFNRYEGEDGVTWYPHVIHNCQLIADKAANVEKSGISDADAARLIIESTETTEGIFFDGVQYLKPKAWKASENPAETLTFQEKTDFFMEGEYSTEPVIESDYMTLGQEGFYHYMNETHDDVFLITTVAMYSLIPHVEIGGN